MSHIYRRLRTRWAAKEMRVIKWLKNPGEICEIGEGLCEVMLDGSSQVIPFLDDEPPNKAGIYHLLVDEGAEVGIWGEIIECSLDGMVLKYPEQEQQLVDLGLYPPSLKFSRRPSYPPVFLSYRRADTEAYAGRLHEALSRELGVDSVFMDTFSILPGEPFPWAVQQAAAHCAVMVVVIGPSWRSVTDAQGNLRLFDEHDLVRREIVAALDRQITVVPVLVPGGVVPTRDEMPYDLYGLEQLQMLELSSRHWTDDVRMLIERIEPFARRS